MGIWICEFLDYVIGNVLVPLTRIQKSGERIDLEADGINLALELLY